MDVVTLGMFIIDEIHFQPPRKPEIDILGGAGSWAVFGARIFRPPPFSKHVGWTVHKGSDFPTKVEDEIRSWSTSCNMIDTPHRLTTRGWNKYGNDDERAFKYMTEKLRIDETQLSDSLLASRCFHLICTPTRCMNLVKGILVRRKQISTKHPDAKVPPMFVWEPVPDSMGVGELNNLYEALSYVDVVSPNHQELAAVFEACGDQPTSMEDQCSMLLKGFTEHSGAVVVRCGERGCYVATKESRFMMPAYHRDAEKVKDPTGAGNAFLGGLCIGLLEGQTNSRAAIEYGAAYGSVAASFAVEQVGLPKLTTTSDDEFLNDDSVEARLRHYWTMVDANR